jgi:hypothetical protein
MGDPYTFPQCIHAFRAGLHRLNVDPAKMTITLPFDNWWALQNAIERQFGNQMVFDGCGKLENVFHYMGIRFKYDLPQAHHMPSV